jgi:hypothetical protein
MEEFIQDPDARLDYKIDWTAWLGADTIAVSLWMLDTANLTIYDESNDTVKAVVWLTDGVNGSSCLVTNRITTAAERINDQSFIVRVRDL